MMRIEIAGRSGRTLHMLLRLVLLVKLKCKEELLEPDQQLIFDVWMVI